MACVLHQRRHSDLNRRSAASSARNVMVAASNAAPSSGWVHGIGKFRNLRQLSLRRGRPTRLHAFRFKLARITASERLGTHL